jgi:hypothetical protein
MAYNIRVILGSGLGSGLGPNFNITANTGSVTPNTGTRDQLLAGWLVSIDDAATLLTVTSVGECTNAISASIPCTPPTTTTSTSTTSTSTSTSTSTTTTEPTTTTSTSTSTTSTTTTPPTCHNYQIEGAPSIDVEWIECDGTTNSDTVTTAIVVCAQTGTVIQTGGEGNITQLSECSTTTTSTSTTTTEPTTTTSTSTTSTSTSTTSTTTEPTTTTSTSTSSTTTTTLAPCVTSVGFEVEVAGEVQYTTCCGTQITEFFGIGPQVINDCLQTNSLFSLDASITDVVYGSTSCTCVTTTSTSTSTSTSTTSTTTTPPTTTTSTSTSTSTTSTTTEPPEFYYTGLICGGSIVGNFYSNTNLGDNPGIVYAFSATAGNTNQCFDNVSVTTTPNDNPILAIFEDCETCNNPTYYYYAIKEYACANSCAYVSPDLVGRSSTALSTIDGVYYKLSTDPNVYQIQTTAETTTWDINLDGAQTNAVCSVACTL